MKNQCNNTIKERYAVISNKVNIKLPPKQRGMLLDAKITAKNKAKSKGKKSLF